MRQNTLNLVGDGDELDMFSDAENAFEVKLTGSELAALHNVGDLYDLIVGKYRSRHPTTQACLRSGIISVALGAPRHGSGGSDCAGHFRVLHRPEPVAGIGAPIRIDIASAGSALDGGRRRALPHLGLDGKFRNRLEFPSRRRRDREVDQHDLRLGASHCLLERILGIVLVPAISRHWFGEIPRRIETIGELARDGRGL